MRETEFINVCEQELEKIGEMLEKKDVNSALDIEYLDGILNIEIVANGKKYVINRNSGNQKIWYSSPFSGADYFTYDDNKNSWFNDSGVELSAKLFNELDQILND